VPAPPRTRSAAPFGAALLLSEYYAGKGAQVHHLIDQLQKGQPVNNAKVAQALDTDAADKYDNRPPVPLDD
jgi:hypothetical protein